MIFAINDCHFREHILKNKVIKNEHMYSGANPVYKKFFARISKQHFSETVQSKMDENENKPLIFLCHAKEGLQQPNKIIQQLKQGHGVGYSQWGGAIMGDRYSYSKILNFIILDQS